MHGSKVVQVKGVMLLSQPNPGKHRPAKPCGDRVLHTFSPRAGISYAGRPESPTVPAFYLHTGIHRRGKEAKWQKKSLS